MRAGLTRQRQVTSPGGAWTRCCPCGMGSGPSSSSSSLALAAVARHVLGVTRRSVASAGNRRRHPSSSCVALRAARRRRGLVLLVIRSLLAPLCGGANCLGLARSSSSSSEGFQSAFFALVRLRVVSPTWLLRCWITARRIKSPTSIPMLSAFRRLRKRVFTASRWRLR